MSYKPTPTLVTTTGKSRASTIDTEVLDELRKIAETLNRIEQQLALITDTNIRPGESLD